MATRNLRSNSAVPEIWPFGVLMEASAPDENDPTLTVNALPAVILPPAPPIMAATVEWKTDPFQGKFNPGTKSGQAIFLEKTKGLAEKDRLELSKSNSAEIHKFFRSKEGQMGEIITKVPIAYANDGTVTKTANMLSQYHLITLDDVQRFAHSRFNNPIAIGDPIPDPAINPFEARDLDPATVNDDKRDFYLQVDSAVVAKLCENCLSTSGYNDLMLNKEKFSFTDQTTGQVKYDGTTMVFLIYQTIDPNTTVGLDNILKKMEKAKLGDFKNNVTDMLKAMKTWCLTLKENNSYPENYRRLLLDALLTGPNATYNSWVQRIVDDVESGIGANAQITPDALIVAASSKYNNMDDKELWAAVDPRDATLLALTTELKEIKAQQKQSIALATAAATGTGGKSDAGKDAGKEYFPGTQVETWRGKYDGPSKKGSGGRVLHWCKHHKHPDGLWDGLYVQHQEKDCKKAKAGNQNDGAGTQPAPAANVAAGNTTKTPLQLQQSLKNVLCTTLCMSEEDVDKLFEKASEN